MAITSGNTLMYSSSNTFVMGTSSTERVRLGGHSTYIHFCLNNTSGNIYVPRYGSIYAESGGVGQFQFRHSSATANRVWRVGMDTGSNFVVYANGTTGTYLTWTGNTWTATSDERVKLIIEGIDDALNKLSNVRTVTGRYNSDEESVSRSFLIAQDFQSILPEAVDVPEDPEKPLGLSYEATIPLVVAGVKELVTQINSVKAEIASVRQRLDVAKTELNTLKNS